jgi:hypothetical protein
MLQHQRPKLSCCARMHIPGLGLCISQYAWAIRMTAGSHILQCKGTCSAAWLACKVTD